MLKLAPILLALGYGLLAYRLSVWRTKRELDDKSSELADPILRVHLDQMAHALGVDRVRVFIYEIDPVNGLAAPDGRIFITRGFLRKYREGLVTAEEMASVFAHELGHVALGHAKRRMMDFSGQNALRMTLGMILGRFIPFVGWYIAELLTRLVSARLSRADEYEADAYAAALLTKAGIGTGPQISLFQKLEKLTGAGGQPLAWLASHPKTQERIAALNVLEARWQP
ncbi:MAG: M48 family metalloprotease [Pseudomonadota bacterium]